MVLSPLIWQANCMSLGIIVHCLVCIAQRLLSSNKLIRYASLASCKAMTAVPWNLIPVMNCWPISWTSLMNGSFLISSSLLFWYFLISHKASVPGQLSPLVLLLHLFLYLGWSFWPSSFPLSCRVGSYLLAWSLFFWPLQIDHFEN